MVEIRIANSARSLFFFDVKIRILGLYRFCIDLSDIKQKFSKLLRCLELGLVGGFTVY